MEIWENPIPGGHQFKAKNILISPVKAVAEVLQDDTLDFILCTAMPVPRGQDRSNVLILDFLDIEDENNPLAFRDGHAAQIVRFLSRPGANEDLFVCCDSGESRSPAIAAAIRLAAGESDMPVWESPEYRPNRLVYARLCGAMGIPPRTASRQP